MKFIILFLLSFMILGSGIVTAQNHIEALRYSQNFYQSDARALGMGNAMGAVGGSFIGSILNPAGLAISKRNEIFITPALIQTNANSLYRGNMESDGAGGMRIGNAGISLTTLNYSLGKLVTEGWVNYTFAFGFNRTNDFHQNTFYAGFNQDNSIMQALALDAQGIDPLDFEDYNSRESQAYFAYLINPVGGQEPFEYYTALDDSAIDIVQQKSIQRRGAANDITFSFAANYSNKLYLGLTLGIPTIGFHERSTYREVNRNPEETNFESLELRESIDTRGFGVHGIFGLIYRPSAAARFGLSVETPTNFRINDNYSFSTTSELLIDDDGTFTSDEGEFDYNLTTPLKLRTSGAFFFEDNGFLSVDYMFSNISKSSLTSDLYDFFSENRNIENFYRSVHDVKFGGEFRYDTYYLRAGLGFATTPFNDDLVPKAANSSSRSYSLGGGFRENNVFLDLGWQLTSRKEFEVPYELGETAVPGAEMRMNRNLFLLTIGTRF
ncbi:MAG: hypothetical protein WD077_11320 [Bacteroidia bacterium]